MSPPSSSLLSLPEDILLTIPCYLRDIEDLVNLSATCRRLHGLSASTSPRTILQLAAAASRIFFRPDPHFLVAATARQLAEWASLTSTSTAELRVAFRGGMEGLLELIPMELLTVFDEKELELLIGGMSEIDMYEIITVVEHIWLTVS